MNRDPIIDEVRAIRETIAREHDYDIAAIFQMLVQAERNRSASMPRLFRQKLTL